MLLGFDLDEAGQAFVMDLVGGLCRYFLSISVVWAGSGHRQLGTQHELCSKQLLPVKPYIQRQMEG